jgi:hypothetical protein
MAFETMQSGQEKVPTFDEWDAAEMEYDKEAYPSGYVWTKVTTLFDDPEIIKILGEMDEGKMASLQGGSADVPNQVRVIRLLKEVQSAAIDARAARRERYQEKYQAPETDK